MEKHKQWQPEINRRSENFVNTFIDLRQRDTRIQSARARVHTFGGREISRPRKQFREYVGMKTAMRWRTAERRRVVEEWCACVGRIMHRHVSLKMFKTDFCFFTPPLALLSVTFHIRIFVFVFVFHIQYRSTKWVQPNASLRWSWTRRRTHIEPRTQTGHKVRTISFGFVKAVIRFSLKNIVILTTIFVFSFRAYHHTLFVLRRVCVSRRKKKIGHTVNRADVDVCRFNLVSIFSRFLKNFFLFFSTNGKRFRSRLFVCGAICVARRSLLIFFFLFLSLIYKFPLDCGSRARALKNNLSQFTIQQTQCEVSHSLYRWIYCDFPEKK